MPLKFITALALFGKKYPDNNGIVGVQHFPEYGEDIFFLHTDITTYQVNIKTGEIS